MTAVNEYNPDYATPPGETIQELIQSSPFSFKEFATQSGISCQHLKQLLAGKQALTNEIAIKLELITSMTASFWMRLEAQYRQDLQRLEKT
jgi:addiction module HigA family antidote